MFYFYSSHNNLDLHSFPTRRSSDLNPDFVQRIKQGDRGNEQFSPRTVMNNFYFKPPFRVAPDREEIYVTDRKSTRLNSSHITISYAVFCLKKKKNIQTAYFELIGAH